MQHFLLKQRWESADKRKLNEIEKRLSQKDSLFFYFQFYMLFYSQFDVDKFCHVFMQ